MADVDNIKPERFVEKIKEHSEDLLLWKKLAKLMDEADLDISGWIDGKMDPKKVDPAPVIEVVKHMENKMSVWERVKQPPARALKQIRGGRLQGMTDINPQWRYEVMTETFGICGIGWKYAVDRTWTENGVEGQVMAFASVSLYVKQDGEWSDAIPGLGGSMMISKEHSGLRSSDEAYKMAITDALSVAMKMIGVAADIYMGKWDGSKYNEQPALAKRADNKPYQGRYRSA